MAKTATKGRTRANGEGSIQRLPDGRYRATIYYTADVEILDGKPHAIRKKKQATCDLKRDADAQLQRFRSEIERLKKGEPADVEQKPKTFAETWDEWLSEHSQHIGAETCGNYRAAYKHMTALHDCPLKDITAGDLQTCIDDCPCGKGTRAIMRSAWKQLYTWAIARHIVSWPINLAVGLKLNYDQDQENYERDSLTNEEMDALWDLAYAGDRDAKIVLIAIHLGMRPSELLALSVDDVHLDAAEPYVEGGSKTKAGKNRHIPIAKKILPFVIKEKGSRTSGRFILTGSMGNAKQILNYYSDHSFFPVIERAGIANPMVPAGGGTMRHRLTPHNCRHTFATMIGYAAANSALGDRASKKDVEELIGHESAERMTAKYQQANLESKAKLVNAMPGRSSK